MNFTREPIIETVMTPKEGYKLAVRNSKGGSQEEYTVDALEVVSFGHSMFFRSQERPKTFLLPVSDYEVVEVKETRVVLKNAPLEGSIKIGTGKLNKPSKENEEKPAAQQSSPKPQEEGNEDRPRRRKSSLRRRRMESGEGLEEKGSDQKQPRRHHHEEKEGVEKEEGQSEGEPPVSLSSTMFKALLPPPPGLISERIQNDKLYQSFREEAAKQAAMKEAQHVEKIIEQDDKEELEQPLDIIEEPTEEEHKDVSQPRYHAAPRESLSEPTYHIENDFPYG